MLNYREKYGDNPIIENHENLSNEVFAIVEKYKLQEDHYVVQCKDIDFIPYVHFIILIYIYYNKFNNKFQLI